MAVLIVVWVICAIAGALIAERKGRSAGLWAVICLLTGVFGILVIAVMSKQTQAAPAGQGRVACPACSEAILPTATLCKHCGTGLTPMAVIPAADVAGPGAPPSPVTAALTQESIA
jgi:hypothetical protein